MAGFDVAFRFQDPAIAAMLADWIDLFLPGPPGPPVDRFTFLFSAAPGGEPEAPPPSARPLVDYYYVSGYVEEGHPVFRGADGSTLKMNLEARTAAATIPPAALAGPPWPLRDLFNAAFTTLLRAGGRYPLHAAALDHPQGGLLIVGPPMAGKTTLALGFLRRGWAWVADDKVLVASDPGGGIEATGLLRQSNIDPGLAEYFPELSALRDRPPAHPHSPKRGASVTEFYGPVTRSHCRPRWILFPRVHDVGATRVEPLPARDAFIELLHQSPLVNDTRATRDHLDLLSRLAAETRAFRLLTARDLLETPDRLGEIGAAAGIPVGEPQAAARPGTE